ncbi:sulfatase-like hydrolase/transferase [Ruminococcaceae bacterium OttesenSCG-928-D13]|nr:sulfatase-like hydrolase/transferase [Ruminococcaceae bacterium OttesenSCG-928-D13]
MKMNTLLIMTDQHRWDYTGYSGAGKVETPNIDRIAQGASFSRCQTVNPICQPARAALLTGRYPHQIHLQSMTGDLDRGIRTFPQALREAGYHTMAAGKLHLLQPWPWNAPERARLLNLTDLHEEMRGYGFDRLWETAGKQLMLRNYCDYSAHLEKKGLLEKYLDSVQAAGENRDSPDFEEDPATPSVLDEADYIDVVTADKMLGFLNARPKDKPFYAHCSFCSPHKPFDPPARYLEMVPYEEVDDFIPGPDGRRLEDWEKKQLWRKRRAYKAMIKLLDDQVGRLLDWLDAEGLAESTLVIFTSDHGEMLGDHFRIQKATPYQGACTVPLAVRHPALLTGRVHPAPVELTDLAATVLEAAGLHPQKALAKSWPAYNSEIPARSLLPVLRGEADRVREFSYTECNGVWQMLQTETMKYVKWLKTPSPDEIVEELYDLEADPDELVNRAGDPACAEQLEWFRRRRSHLQYATQPVQTMWSLKG